MLSTHFKVTAINANGESDYSDTDDATLVTTPKPPTITSIDYTSTSFTINWNDDDNNTVTTNGAIPIVNYKIYRSLDSSSNFVNIDSVYAGSSLEYTDTSCNLGVTYYYYVTVVNGATPAMESDNSNIVSEYPSDKPTEPLNLFAETKPDVAEVTLTWDEPSNTNGKPITAYKVYDGSGNLLQTVDNPVATSTIITKDYSGNNLKYNIEYTFKVTAINVNGESEYSNTVDATLVTTPKPPTITSIDYTSTSLTINWNDDDNAVVTTNGAIPIVNYKIYRSLDSSSNFVNIDSVYAGSSLEYTDTSCKPWSHIIIM